MFYNTRKIIICPEGFFGSLPESRNSMLCFGKEEWVEQVFFSSEARERCQSVTFSGSEDSWSKTLKWPELPYNFLFSGIPEKEMTWRYTSLVAILWFVLDRMCQKQKKKNPTLLFSPSSWSCLHFQIIFRRPKSKKKGGIFFWNIRYVCKKIHIRGFSTHTRNNTPPPLAIKRSGGGGKKP